MQQRKKCERDGFCLLSCVNPMMNGFSISFKNSKFKIQKLNATALSFSFPFLLMLPSTRLF